MILFLHVLLSSYKDYLVTTTSINDLIGHRIYSSSFISVSLTAHRQNICTIYTKG